MSTLDDYNNKLEAIKGVGVEELKSINIPVDVYVQEAGNLFNWCTKDREALTARGLDWALAEDIPVRAGALREAESRWITSRFTREEAGRKWKVDSPGGYNLRNELLDNLRFAYRKDASLTGRVQAIAEGTGHADMIQDLNDLAVLGRENRVPLEAIRFDFALLDEAAEMASQLSTLLAEATGENTWEVKTIRDKAYTFLKQAVDEIYEYGRFVFRDNEERRQRYSSAYLRKLYRRKRNKEVLPEKE